MHTRFRAAVIAVVLLGIVGLLWVCWPAGAPEYGGKSLWAWVDQYYEARVGSKKPGTKEIADEAQRALREIGTNALPALLDRVRLRRSPLREQVVSQLKQRLGVTLPTQQYLHNRADWGFSMLREQGRPAIPDLMVLLRDPDPMVRGTAARCLGHIGPDAAVAIPSLLPLLAERDNGLSILHALDALREIHAQPERVIPALLEFLNGSRTDWNYAEPALNVLRAYGTQATSAVPAIEAYLSHAERSKRRAALHALDNIDPAAAARALKASPGLDD